MDLKKLAPWNWFKDEEKESGSQVAIFPEKASPSSERRSDPTSMFHRDINDLFNRVLHGYGFSSPLGSRDFFQGGPGGILLKPAVDIDATDEEYTITVEVPGIEEKDIKLTIKNDTLIVSGEKRQEKEAKEKNYYKMERSYGAFQRLLSLPEDADQDKVDASFKNGVLSITVPRRALPDSDIKQIQIK